MIDVLNGLERVKAKLRYAILAGHEFIPTSRLKPIIERITNLLGHIRPLEYQPPFGDSIKHKVWAALDEAHKELYDLLISHRQEMVEQVGADKWEDFYNFLAEISQIKDKAYDSEYGQGRSLLKRGPHVRHFPD